MYTDLSFEELINNPSIDIDNDPEAIYAIALCYKYGKGVEVDNEKYQMLRSEAISLGYVEEQQNEETSLNTKAENSDSMDNVDYNIMSIRQLENLGEQGDPLAYLELRDRSINEYSDEVAASRYYDKCTEAIFALDDSIRQGELFRYIGDIHENNEEYEEARKYYEYAREKGDTEALVRLVEYYLQGIGGEIEVDMAYDLYDHIFKKGTEEQKYQLAVLLLTHGEIMKAVDGFERIFEAEFTDTEILYIAKAGLQLLLHSKRYQQNQRVYEYIENTLERDKSDREFFSLLFISWQTERIELTATMAVELAIYAKDIYSNEYLNLLAIAEGKGSEEAKKLKKEYEEELIRLQLEEEAKVRLKEEQEEAERQRILAEAEAERRRLADIEEKKKREFQELVTRAENSEVDAIEELSEYLYENDPERGCALWEKGWLKGSFLCTYYLARYYTRRANYKLAYEWSTNALSMEAHDEAKLEELATINSETKTLFEKEVRDFERKVNYVNDTVINTRKQIMACGGILVIAIILRVIHTIVGKYSGGSAWLGLCGLFGIFIGEIIIASFSSRVIHRYNKLAKNPDAVEYAEELNRKDRLKPYFISQFIIPLAVSLTWLIMGDVERILNGYIYLAVIWAIGLFISVGTDDNVWTKWITFISGLDRDHDR